jgi:hypothetical protein
VSETRTKTDVLSLCGWKGIDAVQKVMAARFPSLQRAGPRLFSSAPPSNAPVLLYKAWYDVLGKDPGYPAQQIGDCTSFGHGHANDLLQCIEIGLGSPMEYRETDTEFIYGASRQVAGILGTGDGSYGSAACHAMCSIGTVSREMLGTTGTYSGARAEAWGKTGPPQAYQIQAAPYKLGMAAEVTTWDGLVAAITNGYPVTICTGQGFVMTRDPDGFCAPEGTWGHCMLIAGIRFDRPGACILQSWGPDQPTGPTALGQPDWSFWCDQQTVEEILAEGDSWALSKSAGFVQRALPPAWSYHSAA